jgi:hypothetical protein
VIVTDKFIWTGGEISGSGQYILQGVTAGRIGFDNTTLNTGSKFILQNRAADGVVIVTNVVQAGTLNLRGATIEVQGGAFEQRRDNPAGQRPTITGFIGLLGDDGIIVTGGAFRSWGGVVPSVYVSSGMLDVKAGGLEVTGVANGGSSVVMTGAGSQIFLKNGETLKVASGVHVKGGTFLTQYDAAVNQIATVDGEFKMTGGTLRMGVESDPGVVAYSTLKVKKTVRLHGGTFETKIDSAAAGNRDAIETEDQLDTRADFIIAPITIGGDGPAAPSPVLRSVNGFTTESVDPTNPNNGLWTMKRSADGKDFTVQKK